MNLFLHGFLPVCRHMLETAEWDYVDFRQVHLPSYLDATVEFMKEVEQDL